MFLIKKRKRNLRLGILKVANKVLETPFYFPIATVGAVKSVSAWELKNLGFNGILANTYHLYLRPGEKLIKSAGGLHKWMGWDDLILTDSGGFQVFSLGNKGKNKKSLVKIKDDGIEFTSHLDGTKHFFTPEKVIQIQLDLGSDIIMPLDICPSGKATKSQAQTAAEKTLEWLKRSKIYFEEKIRAAQKPIDMLLSSNKQVQKNSKQSLNCSQILKKARIQLLGDGQNKIINKPLLFGIIQGATYLDLRREFAQKTLELNLDGYAIGGLAVGEEKEKMWQVVKLMNKILPKNKPRYLMGVGEINDFIKAVNLGIDLVDCVLPTRLARHGIIYKIDTIPKVVKLDLRKKWAKNKLEAIDKNCFCPACKNNLTISYLSHLIKEKEILGHRLLSLHNLAVVKTITNYLKTKKA